MANLRAAYAECSTTVLTGESSGKATLTTDKKSATEPVKMQQKTNGWTGTNADASIGDVAVKDMTPTTGDITVTVTDEGKVTIGNISNK